MSGIFRSRALLVLGTISFSVYLVHTLVLPFAPPGAVWATSALAMTIAISLLTYLFIEEQCREFGRRLALGQIE